MPLNYDEFEILKYLLIEDEGLKLTPYVDCCGRSWRVCPCKVKGKLTIGIGRNLEDVGITESEAMQLQSNDILRFSNEVERSFTWFKKLNSPRKIVIMSMAFNLGLAGLKEFKKMIKCIESGDFRSASIEMLKSQWSQQVKGRAERLATLMEQGTF